MARDELLDAAVRDDEPMVEVLDRETDGSGGVDGLDGVGIDPIVSLRPRSLDEFVGQSELKRRLRVILEAARRRGQPPDHFLFAGPPGLGKTSLSVIVAA